MGACSLRILTGTADFGRKYYTIPLKDKKAYSVANEVTGSEVFSIKAFTVDDKGTPTSQGATPSLIQQYLASETCKISSKTGTCYVNVSLRKKPSNPIAKKAEAFLPIAPVVGMFVGAVKFCMQVADALEENEVDFSITANKTDATKFTFDGELTLLEIGQKATQAKAFAVADKDIGDQAVTVLGGLLAGIGGFMGGIAANENDGAAAISQVYEIVGGLFDMAGEITR